MPDMTEINSYNTTYHGVFLSIHSKETGFDITLNQLLSICSIDPPQGPPCQVSYLIFYLATFKQSTILGHWWKP